MGFLNPRGLYLSGDAMKKFCLRLLVLMVLAASQAAGTLSRYVCAEMPVRRI